MTRIFRNLCVVALVFSMSCTSGLAPADLPPFHSAGKADSPQTVGSWFHLAKVTAHQSSLTTAFEDAGYVPPEGTFLLGACVTEGVDQPAIHLHSLGESGFVYSTDNYWPASTVKLVAAVAALRTLGQSSLTGAARVSFTDDDGSYDGTVRQLYDDAIRVSDNVAYNRLMLLAGFDEINDSFLVPENGLPMMVLQRRYTHPTPLSNLRRSPPVSYSEETHHGSLPERVGTGQHPSCPDEGNCVTLFELMDVLRRVTLHDALPSDHRYPLSDADIAGLRAALRGSPDDFLEPGASQALGHPAVIHNKRGAVWTDDRLENALIEDSVTGERFLLAWSMPYGGSSKASASELTRQTLLALKGACAAAPPLQRDAGIDLPVDLQEVVPGSYRVTIDASGAEVLEAWLDGQTMELPTEPPFAATVDLAPGEHYLVARALLHKVPIGHRAVLLQVP